MDTSPQPAPAVGLVKRVARPAAPYVPAIGQKLRILLIAVFGLFAVLGATGVYLGAVSALNWYKAPLSYTTPFSLWMFLAHIAIGVIGTAPFFAFGFIHWFTARKRDNRVAVRLGVLLFLAGILICATGFALVQLESLPQLPTGSISRTITYWLHVVVPLGAVWLYVKHRQAGPPIKWRLAYGWGFGVIAFTAGMIVMHSQDPQKWFREGPKEGAQYFEPAATRTADGKFINADTLMMDAYCTKCHSDAANDHFHSAHKFSSFNNPAYLFSVRETRKVAKDRDNDVKASRWCAGCHDPVPFLSGAFDDPNFDDVNHPTSQAGITCTVCHAMTHMHGTLGNGGYTLEEPAHYPFAKSENSALQWINQQLVKAKPDFHKQTFLKPFHKTAEFCASCHKVSLPVELNHYKEFLRGQNHYDTYLLSGVSGHGTRSFYYPEKAKTNCADCHMPLQASGDFGAKDFDGSGLRKIHNHRFPGANTGLFSLLQKEPRYEQHSAGFQKTIDMHVDFLKGTAPDGSDKKVRIDLFGIKPGTALDAPVTQLRPELPKLQPGQSYIVEIVVRTLGLGHPFSQGTVDSNEIWVDFQASSGSKVFARNGALANPDETGPVDPWSHFINVHMLDRNGNRINRRNPQDIFTPLYDKQIGPGAAAVVHYRIDVPSGLTAPVELSAKVRYRKFDYEYMALVHKDKPVPKLPIVDICSDKVTLPVNGVAAEPPAQTSPIKAGWQRWNDYGIGSFLEGGGKRGNFRQAEEAFKKILTLGVPEAAGHAHLNLARVYLEEGRLDEAAGQLVAAGEAKPPAPPWSRAWFSTLVNGNLATRKEHLDVVIKDLRELLNPDNQPKERSFDFTKDYVVWNSLASRYFSRRLYEAEGSAARIELLELAITSAERVLALDAEDVAAHDLLANAYRELGKLDPSMGQVEKPTEDWAAKTVTTAANAKEQKAARIAACAGIRSSIPALPTPRVRAIRDAIEQLRPAYHSEGDPELKAALAATIGALHRESHTIYKPDEVARSNSTQIYRQKNPVANYAARDRVVYPTTDAHRESILKVGELPR